MTERTAANHEKNKLRPILLPEKIYNQNSLNSRVEKHGQGGYKKKKRQGKWQVGEESLSIIERRIVCSRNWGLKKGYVHRLGREKIAKIMIKESACRNESYITNPLC